MFFHTNRMKLPLSITLCSVAASGLLVLSGCSKPTDANAENFTAAMNTYLAKRGDLCVAKSSWPIDVTATEMQGHARNAVQMPVLEKLGLASSSETEIEVKDDDGVSHRMLVRRYELTDAGKKYYVMRDTVQRDGSKVPKGDFCAAKLSLDKVVQWAPHTPPKTASLAGAAPVPADKSMVVTYTYKAEAAPWMQDPDAQKVFPVVSGVLHSAGTAQLTETFRLTDAGWVAVDL
jgi:hypothetical protein